MNDLKSSDMPGSLANIAVFADFPVDLVRRIEGLCRWLHFAPGETVIDYLEQSDDVYFIADGEVRVIIHSPTGKAVSFRDLGAGEMFGEIPAIDGGPRSAGVEARSPCLVAALPGAAFRDLLAAEPLLAQALLRREVQVVRRLTSRVYDFSAAVMAITGRRVYGEMQGIRAKDVYPDEEVKAYLVDKTFPTTAEDLTLRLSNVTAAFYGVMLKLVGEKFGWDQVDPMSRAVFRLLGQLKTREALEGGVDLPRDTRAPSIVFITAVHSASPEYNFHVLEYSPEQTVLRVFGTSRYDRIAQKLGIEEHLTWPELTPFFQGVAEELGIRCRVEGDLKELGEGGVYDCIYRFTLQ